MPGIFITYRRDDSGGYAGRLHERLSRHFSRELVFIDVDDISAGQDFAKVLHNWITSCDVLLVLIGKRWLTITDHSGRRRLDDPADFVRLEITAALQRSITVVPVLVGGAEMPAHQDLPGPIVRLAYLNAFEIHDRAFEESVRHLIALLSESVKARSVLWWWRAYLREQWRKRPVSVVLGTSGIVMIVGLLLMRSIAERFPESVVHTRKADSTVAQALRKPTPVSSRIQEKPPHRISRLPPVVESARNGFSSLNSAQVTGPRNPKVIWRAEFYRENVDLIGVAGDGTLYAWEDLAVPLLVAIREGKEQWAYRIPENLGKPKIAPDGRVWIAARSEDTDTNHFYCFNSRGEGGLVSGHQDPPKLIKERMDVNRSGWQTTAGGRAFRYEGCSLGELSGTSPKRLQDWKLQLDGNCTSSVVNEQGEILVGTDAGTLYCINPEGRVRWSYKAGCEPGRIFVLLRDEAVYDCGGALYGLRGRQSRWKFAPEGGAGLPKEELLLFDKANTIYMALKHADSRVVALDEDGQLLWKRDLGAWVTPKLLDKDGRLYVRSGGGPHSKTAFACLSDQ